MAKKDKKDKVVTLIPEGMKCYQKINGGSWRTSNRIIKQGQKFWINPEAIPAAFADAFKEVAADYKAIVVETNLPVQTNKQIENTNVAEKFEVVVATDENGEAIKKGKDNLFNVIDEAGKAMNEKPLRKGKADELFEALNA